MEITPEDKQNIQELFDRLEKQKESLEMSDYHYETYEDMKWHKRIIKSFSKYIELEKEVERLKNSKQWRKPK